MRNETMLMAQAVAFPVGFEANPELDFMCSRQEIILLSPTGGGAPGGGYVWRKIFIKGRKPRP